MKERAANILFKLIEKQSLGAVVEKRVCVGYTASKIYVNAL
jgi:hypothetical protein